MENYYSKIRKLDRELETLRTRYRILCVDRDMLIKLKRMGAWSNQNELELKQIQNSINTVRKNIHNVYDRVWRLRRKYMRKGREFFNPMDDVDIIMLIHKDGSIHGITL